MSAVVALEGACARRWRRGGEDGLVGWMDATWICTYSDVPISEIGCDSRQLRADPSMWTRSVWVGQAKIKEVASRTGTFRRMGSCRCW